MAKQKEPKDPFSSLDPGFKDGLEGATVDQLKAKLAEVAKAEEANQSSKKADEELNRLKAQVKNASLGFAELSKRHRLQLKYLIRQLADKGDEVAQTIIQNDISAEMQKA
jgi:lantibiotic modifying enzyme